MSMFNFVLPKVGAVVYLKKSDLELLLGSLLPAARMPAVVRGRRKPPVAHPGGAASAAPLPFRQLGDARLDGLAATGGRSQVVWH
jgi:hypothetical protein